MKVDLDKFYTKPEIAKMCIDMVDVDRYITIDEPSSGAGAFSNQIPGCNAMDIAPEDDSIIKQDYFEYEPKDVASPCLVIGNPAFGKNNNLAVKFFNKAATYADTIAFILPKSFRKDSVTDRLSRWFHLDKEIDLPKNSFLVNDEEYDVPCIFQIWKKRDNKRQKSVKEKPRGFRFVKSRNDADFSVKRVGGSAGTALSNLDVSEQSHNFIAIDDKSISINDVISEMNQAEYSHNNTVAQKSLTQSDISSVLNKIIERLASVVRKIRKVKLYIPKSLHGKINPGKIILSSEKLVHKYPFYHTVRRSKKDGVKWRIHF